MANTVFGPYAKTTWVDGTTMGNQTRMNNLESQANIVMHGINPDLSGPFVLSGIACTKDGTTANQLDIASGVAYVTMSDGTTGRITVAADNTHTTSALSSTYNLYLQPDGTWYWSTSNSPATNSLPICTVATDGSGNISSVTDLRHTAGSPGVPILMAKSTLASLTVTAARSYALFTPSVSGFYRASLFVTYRNATPQKPVAYFNYYDLTLGAYNSTSYFMLTSTAAQGQFMSGTQATSPGNNQSLSTMPMTAFSAAGQAIAVVFQDPGGAPNDVVTATIERIG